jgi:hypothetical protein
LISAGTPFKKWARNFTLGEAEHGGTVFPAAETSMAEVANFPGLADISVSMYLQPWRAITLSYICTVFIPVSSMFHMSPEPSRRRPNTSFRFIKEKH